MALIVSKILVAFGVIAIFIAGIGVLRMPDLLTRMQAASKASSLGVLFIMLGISIGTPSLEVILKSLLISFLILVTIPIATHAIAIKSLAEFDSYNKKPQA